MTKVCFASPTPARITKIIPHIFDDIDKKTGCGFFPKRRFVSQLYPTLVGFDRSETKPRKQCRKRYLLCLLNIHPFKLRFFTIKKTF